MNKLRTLLTWGLLAAVTHVMGYTITVSPVEIKAGQSTNLIINLNNTETNLTAYQMSLYLPQGVTVQKKANGKYNCTFNGDRQDVDFFNTSVKDAADGSLLITCYSDPKSAITGTSGELLRLSIEVASTVTSSLQGSIRNIEFTDLNTQPHNISDVNFTMTLDGGNTPVTGITLSQTSLSLSPGSSQTLTVTIQPTNATNKSVTWSSSNTSIATVDQNGKVTAKASGSCTITCAAQDGSGVKATCAVTVVQPVTGNVTVSVPDTKITAGGSTNLIINMQTDLTNLTAYQMSLYLPQGVTVKKKSNGKYDCTFNGDRQDVDFFNTSVKDAADGSLLITCYSDPKSAITGTSGELLRLSIEVASTVTSSLQGSIRNIEFTDLNTQPHNISDVSFTMKISGGTSPAITFTDAKVKALCVANWDTNGDGELSEAEAAAVTDLGTVFYGNKEISSFNELQYFTGLTSIGEEAFRNCSKLTSITIPGSVTSIGEYAFYNCSGLASINIPDGVTSIGQAAFRNCSGLTSVNIPEGVTSIAQATFYGCSSLTSIDIPEGVTSIGERAFYGCSSLTSVTIPKGVTSIGNYAFYNCSGLKSVTSLATTPPALGSSAFSGISSKCVLTIPAGTRNAYISAGWTEDIFKGGIVEDGASEPGFSNNKQYLIHTRDKIRGSLGVTEKHLASTNPTAYGPWVCKPVVLDKDNPLITSVSQLSSPYTEPTEGSLAAMIDGNPETFWHSIWSEGDVEPGEHYFQVEMLNQANIDVAFKVIRRNAADNHTTEWGVYGTNNANATKAGCTSLAVIETPYNDWGETRVSDIFKTGGYKYLRFYINNTTTGHGFGHLAEFQLYPATTDEAYGDASPFAIIQKNEGYYLYSVLDKAFITPVNDGDENAYPWQFTDNVMNIYKHDDYFVFDFIDTGYTINVNNEPGIAINDYGTLTDRFDDGNLFTIEEVGDFDPTEALAMFDIQIFTVTYEVRYNSKVVATATEEVASGSPLPPVPASLDNDFVTLTKTGTHPATVTNNVTVRYNATWKGPFEFSKDEGSAKWYNMHIRSGWYVGKQDTEPYYPAQADEATLRTPAYQWAFGGDPYHVKVYNRTTGLAETLTKDGDNAVMRSGDYTWDILPNSDGFVLRVPGTEHSCINQIGGGNGPLQFWDVVNSLTDDGSTFRVVEPTVIELPDYVINDETTSLNIEAEESGMKVEFTHAFNGEWEALYLPFAIDYDAIKANFDLAEIDGVVQNDDDNDGTPDFTVLSIMGFREQMTEPNTPYLIRAKKAGKQTINFENVTVYPTTIQSIDCSSTSTKYEFTGSYSTLDASALTGRYIVQGGELVKGASSLAPCCWYMTATARKGRLNLPNKIRIMSVDDVITGVSLTPALSEGEGDWYDLSGRKIDKPQKGVNIIRYSDGTSKKVLVK